MSSSDAPGFGPGLHAVGTELPPGVYENDGAEPCGAARMSAMTEPLDASGRFSPNRQTLGFVPSGLISDGHLAITVLPTDTGFFAFQCGGWHLAVGPPQRSFGPGTWVVGKDIEPGRYQGQNAADLSCQWERLSGLTYGAQSETIELSPMLVSDAAPVVEIQPTDVGFAQRHCGTFTKIG